MRLSSSLKGNSEKSSFEGTRIQLIQSGDVSRAVQLAKAAIVAVDDEKSGPIGKDQLNEKRTKVIRHLPWSFI